ncbi:unnamed protein product [Coregonus sp. 'balchen']|nr:unnamed protein product [Coregonus sp. 'balchen']
MLFTDIEMDELAYIIAERGLKQPVKLLLGFLVCCTTIFLVSLIMSECMWLLTNSKGILYVDTFVLFTAFTSMSTSVWLNFFYYTQIVPAQRALFILVKRNIKIIIYWGLFVDRVFFLFDLAVNIFYDLIEGNDNNTYTNDTVSGFTDGLYYTYLVFFYSKIIYMFFVCV